MRFFQFRQLMRSHHPKAETGGVSLRDPRMGIDRANWFIDIERLESVPDRARCMGGNWLLFIPKIQIEIIQVAWRVDPTLLD